MKPIFRQSTKVHKDLDDKLGMTHIRNTTYLWILHLLWNDRYLNQKIVKGTDSLKKGEVPNKSRHLSERSLLSTQLNLETTIFKRVLWNPFNGLKYSKSKKKIFTTYYLYRWSIPITVSFDYVDFMNLMMYHVCKNY